MPILSQHLLTVIQTEMTAYLMQRRLLPPGDSVDMVGGPTRLPVGHLAHPPVLPQPHLFPGPLLFR